MLLAHQAEMVATAVKAGVEALGPMAGGEASQGAGGNALAEICRAYLAQTGMDGLGPDHQTGGMGARGQSWRVEHSARDRDGGQWHVRRVVWGVLMARSEDGPGGRSGARGSLLLRDEKW